MHSTSGIRRQLTTKHFATSHRIVYRSSKNVHGFVQNDGRMEKTSGRYQRIHRRFHNRPQLRIQIVTMKIRWINAIGSAAKNVETSARKSEKLIKWNFIRSFLTCHAQPSYARICIVALVEQLVKYAPSKYETTYMTENGIRIVGWCFWRQIDPKINTYLKKQ